MNATAGSSAPPAAARGDDRSTGPAWRTLTMVGALAVIWIAFSIATDGTFLSPRNLSLLARQMAVTSILATFITAVSQVSRTVMDGTAPPAIRRGTHSGRRMIS